MSFKMLINILKMKSTTFITKWMKDFVRNNLEHRLKNIHTKTDNQQQILNSRHESTTILLTNLMTQRGLQQSTNVQTTTSSSHNTYQLSIPPWLWISYYPNCFTNYLYIYLS